MTEIAEKHQTNGVTIGSYPIMNNRLSKKNFFYNFFLTAQT